jgi:hypothetical protein
MQSKTGYSSRLRRHFQENARYISKLRISCSLSLRGLRGVLRFGRDRKLSETIMNNEAQASNLRRGTRQIGGRLDQRWRDQKTPSSPPFRRAFAAMIS